MRELEWRLVEMTKNNRDGSDRTQRRRREELGRLAKQLYAAGYRDLKRPEQLGGRHVNALVDRWKADGLSSGTMKNYASTLRWVCRKAGRESIMPKTNDKLGIERRQTPPNSVNHARTLTPETLERVPDPYVKLSLRAEAAFGLRGEEAQLLQPERADRGDVLRLEGSWCKGGRERDVPIRTPEQRALLDELKAAARDTPKGSLIPTATQKEHADRYRNQTHEAGIRGHGLRHEYAQRRYADLTAQEYVRRFGADGEHAGGWECPRAGGSERADLTDEQRRVDHDVRMVICEELGHGREDVSVAYLGR